MKKKKTNIKTIIRQMVREEVAMAIQEVITELKQPTESQPKPQKKIVEKKSFTKNSILNEVMNETAATAGEWKTMGDKTYTTDKMGDVLNKSYGELMNGSSTNTDGSLAREMGIDPNNPAAAFLTKDYSKVVKAMDKKNG